MLHRGIIHASQRPEKLREAVLGLPLSLRHAHLVKESCLRIHRSFAAPFIEFGYFYHGSRAEFVPCCGPDKDIEERLEVMPIKVDYALSLELIFKKIERHEGTRSGEVMVAVGIRDNSPILLAHRSHVEVIQDSVRWLGFVEFRRLRAGTKEILLADFVRNPIGLAWSVYHQIVLADIAVENHAGSVTVVMTWEENVSQSGVEGVMILSLTFETIKESCLEFFDVTRFPDIGVGRVYDDMQIAAQHCGRAGRHLFSSAYHILRSSSSTAGDPAEPPYIAPKRQAEEEIFASS